MTLAEQPWQWNPSGVRGISNGSEDIMVRSPSSIETILRPSKPKQENASHGFESNEEAGDRGTSAFGDGRVGEQRAPIEVLPPELLLYLSCFLDLAGLIVLSTATSRTLRTVFHQFDRKFLFLEPSHRLNLAEWREAARQIEKYTLTRQDGMAVGSSRSAPSESEAWSPTKVQINLDVAMLDLTRDESLIDLDLFKAVLEFLSLGETRQRQDESHREKAVAQHERLPTIVNQIRCLYLTGWHGIAGTFLIQQLREVGTIVKTERADTRIWQHAAVEDQALRTQTRSTDRDWIAPLRSPVPHPLLQSGPVNIPPSITRESFEEAYPFLLGFEHCTSTQIIVQVGKRRPRREGQAYLRGEGLQMGYQGYCIDVVITGPDMDKDAADAGCRMQDATMLKSV